jgi:CRISPR-associated protein Cas1
MSRPLCDPIDLERVIASLRRDGGSVSSAYWGYASTAARPYASKTFYQIVLAAKRNKLLPYANKNVTRKQTQLDNADLDELSDTYWKRFLSPKSSIVTTTEDNASLKVRGNALIVYDGDNTLTYQASAPNKPKAIVMTGWSGLVSIEAMRFCHDNNISIILLDWSRNFLSIVAPPVSQSARIVRMQCAANPVNVAREVIRQKLAAYVSVNALSAVQGMTHSLKLDAAQSTTTLLAVEALAARTAWLTVPSIRWRTGGPPIPPAWKLPYSTRGRYKAGSPRRASHPVNAMLNAAFAVTAGRLTTYLTAQGLCVSVGFLHSDKINRYSLTFDAIEPLRPITERKVFGFINRSEFASNDFILTTDGTIRLSDNLFRVLTVETAVSERVLNGVTGWIISLLGSKFNNVKPIPFSPSLLLDLD